LKSNQVCGILLVEISKKCNFTGGNSVKAIDTFLTKFIGSEAQYYVPIYQRKYSWKRDQCLKLLEDIVKVAKDSTRPCHFIGSVIYLAKDDSQHAAAIKEYLVIDGQQRLTTLSLLLLALGDYTKEKLVGEEYDKSPCGLEKILRKYLINEDEDDDLRYKVRLNAEDFLSYKKLLNHRKKPEDIKYSRIFENYTLILNQMRKQAIDPQLIFNGIKKLALVDICLVPNDNAQLVFETVNSTGLPLSIPDKIRNFILMTVSPTKQEELYNDYWHPIELEFNLDRSNGKFNEFFSYFMTAALKKKISSDYYDDFKDYYYANNSDGAEGVLKTIRRYSRHYSRFLNAKASYGIDDALCRIRETNQLLIVPAVLKILDDLDQGKVETADALRVLRIIEAYWMRRIICNLPSNTAGTVCLSMLNNLDEQRYVEKFVECIQNLTWAQRMPKNDELIVALHTVPIYGRSIDRYLLDRLEEHENKDYVHNSKFTIEHIMPQTINNPAKTPKEDWVADLGEAWEQIHTMYLNTLGNLTLSGYNSEYQNYRFTEKRDMENGYKDTPIRISETLKHLTAWNEEEICKRSDFLAAIIIDIWKYLESGT